MGGSDPCSVQGETDVLDFLGLAVELGKILHCIMTAFLSLLEISPVDIHKQLQHSRYTRGIFNSGGWSCDSRQYSARLL